MTQMLVVWLVPVIISDSGCRGNQSVAVTLKRVAHEMICASNATNSLLRTYARMVIFNYYTFVHYRFDTQLHTSPCHVEHV